MSQEEEITTVDLLKKTGTKTSSSWDVEGLKNCAREIQKIKEQSSDEEANKQEWMDVLWNTIGEEATKDVRDFILKTYRSGKLAGLEVCKERAELFFSSLGEAAQINGVIFKLIQFIEEEKKKL